MSSGVFTDSFHCLVSSKGRHTLWDVFLGSKEMLLGLEEQTTTFVYTHGTHINARWWHQVDLVYFYIVAGTGCKRSVNDATLKIEPILALLHDG